MAEHDNAGGEEAANGEEEELSLFSSLKRPLSKLDEAIIASREMPLPADALVQPKGIIEKAVDLISRREGPYVSINTAGEKPAIEIGWKTTF